MTRKVELHIEDESSAHLVHSSPPLGYDPVVVELRTPSGKNVVAPPEMATPSGMNLAVTLMCQPTPAKVITASELRARIEAGVTDFEGFTIEGDVDLSGMTLKDLNFRNAIFKGLAKFECTNQSRVAPARRATRGL